MVPKKEKPDCPPRITMATVQTAITMLVLVATLAIGGGRMSTQLNMVAERLDRVHSLVNEQTIEIKDLGENVAHLDGTLQTHIQGTTGGGKSAKVSPEPAKAVKIVALTESGTKQIVFAYTDRLKEIPESPTKKATIVEIKAVTPKGEERVVFKLTPTKETTSSTDKKQNKPAQITRGVSDRH